MARDLSAGFLAAIAAGTVRPVVFYEGVFSTGTLRLWSGAADIVWNAQTWTPAGALLSVSAAEETSELRAVSFSVSLNGQMTAAMAIALQACRTGMDGTVWLGVLDAAGAVIADPFTSFKGRLDAPDVADDGTNATISVRYESRLVDLDRVRERRYTPEDQKIDYPADRGFDLVPALQDLTIDWGRA